MYNSDVFAVITAHDQKNKASSALELDHNLRWFYKATGGVAFKPTIDSRDTTPAEDSQDDEEMSSTVNRLVVSFSKLLALGDLMNGLQLGTNPVCCHVLLGHRGTKGISGRQCNIVVDDNLNIWLHDYHSTHGTAVGQNGKNQNDVRRKETWLMAYPPGAPGGFQDMTINCGSLAIMIEFPNHRDGAPSYVENLRAFVEKCQKAAENPTGIGALGLESEPLTQAPSEAPTPRDRLVYYELGTVGTGAYGQVIKIIKARDGKVLAAKKFNPPPNRNKRRWDDDYPRWLRKIRREFDLVKDNPHPNVIKVFELRETPEPTIIMEYYPLGHIDSTTGTNEAEYVTAWGQILDGLQHLHAKGVAHRDLKPENILIERSPLFRVVIADFGMAKVTKDKQLRTFCGTLKYVAPEVFPGIIRDGLSDGYDFLADIFSLGVMVYDWMYIAPILPETPAPGVNGKVSSDQWYDWLKEWVGLLYNKLEDEESDPAIEILDYMVVDVDRRWSAKKCLAHGLDNGLFDRRREDGLVINHLGM
ncbi:kinase-like protein [Amniculicola lignicola CBS 123094]|uniref:non-specific serine/threonine protein kinase n=1 Tax=Amniculicola lignicola CBS 123094 TaxID=1392246 RepID=A0A6A5X4M7_9PLEO|nr:kinase-like protein [Amniculicola lignicola CBS 123094]